MRAFRSAYVIRPELGIEWTASAWDIPAFEFLRQYGLDEYAQLGKHIASGGAFILNFVLVNETGYFDNAAETKPMLHLWSLAVEEQFYIIWPLMLWLAWKLKINLLIITTLVAFVSFGLNIRFVDVEPAQIFFGPVGRFWEILSGSILAWLLLYQRDKLSALKLWIESKVVGLVYSQKGEGDGTIVANVMSLAGLSILAYGLVRIDSDSGFPGIWALLPVSGTLLVIAAGSKAFFNRALLMNPLAIWIGLISYPLYLWHWPILSFLRIVEGGERWPRLSVQPNPIYKWIPCQLGRDALRQFIKVNAVRCHPVKS